MITDDYQLTIEAPCRAGDYDQFLILDAEVDQEIERGFYVTHNLDSVRLSALTDGSIILFVKKEDLV